MPEGRANNQPLSFGSSSSAVSLTTDPEQPQAVSTARLVIEDPRLSDEALYKCDVTYVKGKCPSISLVKLQMMALPSKAQITHLNSNSPGQPLAEGQLVGTYSEHEQLQLGCLVYGGRPQAKSVIWRKIDARGQTVNLMSARYSTKAGKDFSSNLLEVDLNHTLTSDDLGAKFECHVEHEALEQGVRVRQVDSMGAQPAPPVDATLDLHPAASSSSPLEQQDRQQPFGGFTRSKSLDSHVLIDLNVGVASVDLFLSKVNRRNSSEPLELREGDLVELECAAYNSKPPANITWFNGAEPIEQLLASEMSISSDNNSSLKRQQPAAARHKRLLQRNQVQPNSDGLTYDTHSYLSIRLSRHEHRAQIQCRAQNSLVSRQPLVKTLELQVQHAPIVLMEPASGVQVNEYEPAQVELGTADEEVPVSIYCIYSANPSELAPNSTRWFKDGKLLALSASTRLSESLTATGYPVLAIRQPNRSDAGSYECQVSNALGSSERLPASEQSRLEVNFKPSVRLRIFRQADSSGAAEESSSNPSTELEPNQELIQVGNGFMLNCDVLEARPAKIQAFHWFKRASGSSSGRGRIAGTGPASSQLDDRSLMSEADLIAVTESPRFLIHSLAANFTPSSFSCAALNSLGSSKRSNQIDLQLSYSPGPSFVRPVSDPAQRKALLTVGTTHLPSLIDSDPRSHILHQQRQQQPFAAGRELLLECVTLDLGQPRANLWLWFKNGQPIDSNGLSWPIGNPQSSSNSISNNNNNLFTNGDKDLISNEDNPITGQELSTPPLVSTLAVGADTNNEHKRVEGSSSYLKEIRKGFKSDVASKQPNIKLISSGRYLFISSIQLSHKGNYSCVAVNRFGSGLQQSSTLERDSYRVNVALAPSFIQPLVPRSYWPEVQIEGQLELVCHVQCEPICQIEWLRNNELMDLKMDSASLSESSKYVTYQESHTIIDENVEHNQFKSVKSKLILQFHSGHEQSESQQKGDNRVVNDVALGTVQKLQDRTRLLDRRSLLSGVNYTCQSSSNFMGPSVRSTTKFIVQYPPENVLISSPSDKLSFVEGSNGPRLSCGASGEPQVQYRWFLLKSVSGDLSILDKTSRSAYDSSKSSTSSFLALISHFPPSSADGGERNPPIADHLVSRTIDDSIWEASKGLNDSKGSENSASNLIELTGSATEHVGDLHYSSSNLDLSNLSLDRRQSGYYVCEASNRLGQTRQSVYVDVLYKPTCTTLHLHSLDLVMPLASEKLSSATKDEEYNVISIRPFRVNAKDEYSLVQETNEDYITLRKILVLSPLLRKYTHNSGGELAFKGSIFDTIFKEGRGPHQNRQDENNINSNEALIHSEDNVDVNNQAGSHTANRDGDSWARFNQLLLRILNGYMKRIKKYEDQVTLASDTPMSKEKLHNRRSPTISLQQSMKDDNSESNEDSSKTGTKNLLTFACMAKDANPMSNLTFDWSFGSIAMPADTNNSPSNVDSSTTFAPNESKSVIKPILVYVNSNYTLQITLVRRLDTRTMLNPFQLSLVTLNVMMSSPVGSNFNNIALTTSTDTQRSARQTTERASGQQRTAFGGQRYQSDRASLRANLDSNNIQSNSEIDTSRPYDLLPSLEIDGHNWQEQVGNLLKCRVTNQIGTSDFCHVRVNIAERLKSQSSPSEFARWRMPSLASKSLLIISILIGCTLIIFVTFALLAGPYIREFSLRKEVSGGGSSRDSNNIAKQSDGCQKSSVLGLLGNVDTSTQGSSDDDISAKMNYHAELRNTRLQNSLKSPGDRLSLNLCTSTEYRQKRHIIQESHAGYDKPRDIREERLIYHCGKFIESTRKNFHSQNEENLGSLSSTIRAPESSVAFPNKEGRENSTANRLLANLRFKSLTKFKVDKISDLSDLSNRVELVRNLHTKNISSSETNTTGLSASGLDSEQLASPMSSGSPSFFEPSVIRDSSTSYKTPLQTNPSQFIHNPSTHHSTTQRNHKVDSNRQFCPPTMISNVSSTLASPAYSNMIIQEPYNAMDEFIRRREIDQPLEQDMTNAFYRSQSVRNQAPDQLMYPSNNDLNQYCPPLMSVNPVDYYHTHQTSTLYRSQPVQDTRRPPISARSSHKPILTTNYSSQQYQPAMNNNRFSMPVYDQTYSSRHDGVQMATIGYVDTIDSHLNRLADSVTTGLYPKQNQQITYANTLDKNSYSLNLYQDGDRNLSGEHIYDVNAYATPEQTPHRRPSSMAQPVQSTFSNDGRVSQLIQSFNSKAPE